MAQTGQRIVVPFDGHVIGQGLNSDTGERVGTGLVVGAEGRTPWPTVNRRSLASRW